MEYKKLIVLMILLINASCRNDKTKKSNFINHLNDSISAVVVFPDTVLINKNYNGIIYFQSPLDSINLKERDRRYVFFFVKETDTREFLSIKNLLNTKHDTFVAFENGKIPIWDISFQKTGDSYLYGYIKDEVILFNYYSKRKRSRIITNLSRVIIPVYVRDGKNP